MQNNKPIWIEKETKLIKNKPGIFLATPVHSNVSLHYFLSVINFQNKCHVNKINLNVGMNKSSLVTQGRNLCVNDFFKAEILKTSDYLLFIDSDIEFNYETIIKMIEADKDVIAAPYPLKCIDWNKIQESSKNVDDPDILKNKGSLWPLKSMEDDKTIKVYENGIAEVGAVPTGCTLIKRSVFEKMIKEYPNLKIKQDTYVNGELKQHDYLYNFFDTYFDEKTNKYYGEDYNFCRLWKAIGGKVHIVLTEKVVHVGEYRYEGNILDTIKKVD